MHYGMRLLIAASALTGLALGLVVVRARGDAPAVERGEPLLCEAAYWNMDNGRVDYSRCVIAGRYTTLRQGYGRVVFNGREYLVGYEE
jgi:hypothetical protein